MTLVNTIGLVVVLALGLTAALYQLTHWTDPEADEEYARIDQEADTADAFARDLERIRALNQLPYDPERLGS